MNNTLQVQILLPAPRSKNNDQCRNNWMRCMLSSRNFSVVGYAKTHVVRLASQEEKARAWNA